MPVDRKRRSWSDSQPLTFRRIAAREGDPLPNPVPQTCMLEDWFASVCDLPLSKFPRFDLARSCRQGLFLDHIVPLCLKVLATDPLAGELYHGEMLVALMSLPPAFWSDHPKELRELLPVAKAAFEQADDEKLMKEIVGFLEKHDGKMA